MISRLLYIATLLLAPLTVFFTGNFIYAYWWIFVFCVLLAGILFIEKRTEGSIDCFSPAMIFLFATFVFFIFPPLFYAETDGFTLSLVLVILSIPSFYFGYFLFKRRGMLLNIPDHEWSTRAVFYVSLFLLPLSLGIFLYILRSYGGLFEYVGHIWAASRDLYSGKAYLLEAMLFPAVAAYFLFSDYLREKKRSILFLAIAVFAFYALEGLIISAERGSLIIPLFTFMLIYHYQRKRLNVRTLIFVCVAVLALLVFLGALRDFIHFEDIGGTEFTGYFLAMNFFWYAMVHAGGMIFDVYRNTVSSVPADIPYQYGFTYLVYAIKFVPRIFIPDKVQGASQIVMENLYPKVTDAFFTPSYLGELYMNFGFLGIPIGAFILGVLFGKLYAILKTNLSNRLMILIYALLIPSLIFEMRGDFGNMTTLLIMTGVRLFVFYWAVKLITSAIKNIRRTS